VIVGHAYQLSGLQALRWDSTHVKFGQPDVIAAVYIGSLTGSRTWHLFEVRVAGEDAGVLLLPDADLVRITVEEIP
jgi:hypothetical protein